MDSEDCYYSDRYKLARIFLPLDWLCFLLFPPIELIWGAVKHAKRQYQGQCHCSGLTPTQLQKEAALFKDQYKKNQLELEETKSRMEILQEDYDIASSALARANSNLITAQDQINELIIELSAFGYDERRKRMIWASDRLEEKEILVSKTALYKKWSDTQTELDEERAQSILNKQAYKKLREEFSQYKEQEFDDTVETNYAEEYYRTRAEKEHNKVKHLEKQIDAFSEEQAAWSRERAISRADYSKLKAKLDDSHVMHKRIKDKNRTKIGELKAKNEQLERALAGVREPNDSKNS